MASEPRFSALGAPPQLTVQQALDMAAALPVDHIPYDALGLVGWFCLADGEPWPCLHNRQETSK